VPKKVAREGCCGGRKRSGQPGCTDLRALGVRKAGGIDVSGCACAWCYAAGSRTTLEGASRQPPMALADSTSGRSL